MDIFQLQVMLRRNQMHGGRPPPTRSKHAAFRSIKGARDAARWHPSAEDVVRLADALAARVKAVAFDMDQCMVAQHSHGRLSKVYLPQPNMDRARANAIPLGTARPLVSLHGNSKVVWKAGGAAGIPLKSLARLRRARPGI